MYDIFSWNFFQKFLLLEMSLLIGGIFLMMQKVVNTTVLKNNFFHQLYHFTQFGFVFLPPSLSHSVVHQHMQHSCTLWIVYNFTDCLFGTFTYQRVNYKSNISSSKFRHDWSDKKKDNLYNNWLLRCKWDFGTQLYVQLITLYSAKVLNRLKLYLIEI